MIETKVVAATAGSGAGGVLATFTTWLLGVYVWGASPAADQAEAAVAAVPTPVAALVVVIVTAVGALIAGYAAPHTSRLDASSASANDMVAWAKDYIDRRYGPQPPAPPEPSSR
jgi:hypothetical protein